MVIGGQEQTVATIGELAAVLQRRPGTIRAWERRGLIPTAPIIIQPGDDPCTRRRLYPIELFGPLQELTRREGFGRRRPSGAFLHQQQEIWATWRSVVDSLNSEAGGPGITGPVG